MIAKMEFGPYATNAYVTSQGLDQWLAKPYLERRATILYWVAGHNYGVERSGMRDVLTSDQLAKIAKLASLELEGEEDWNLLSRAEQYRMVSSWMAGYRFHEQLMRDLGETNAKK